jgi:hypothetical protein
MHWHRSHRHCDNFWPQNILYHHAHNASDSLWQCALCHVIFSLQPGLQIKLWTTYQIFKTQTNDGDSVQMQHVVIYILHNHVECMYT